jgi:hypothetical protein
MSPFNVSRFLRLFSNDLLLQWRNIWISTLALAGIGLICYLTNLDPHSAIRPELHVVLYSAALLGGGLVLTSSIFADMHHPLQNAQYLTLPCSNLERFFSRYLLTGPVCYLYVLVGYTIFDWVAGVIADAVMGTRAAAFAPFSPCMERMTLWYFGLLALMFGGAIYFRSHALIKTALSIVLIGFGLLLLYVIALRLIFWGQFTTLLPNESVVRIDFFVVPPAVLMAGTGLLYLWVLFVSYQCLREHEVQREL